MPKPLDLSELVALALDRMERDGAEGLESVCREHPAEAVRLRRRIARLRDFGLLDGGATTDLDLEAELPERLGDFRPLEVIGGGGMGLVVRAVQESLGREVALKIVRPEQLVFRSTRERFTREVETISRLQHPGIVKIHGVFEEQGLPFFAMERVHGATLADILLRLTSTGDVRPEAQDGRALARAVILATGDAPPNDDAPLAWAFRGTYVDACLRLIRQVAEALAYAHANGVVHRDVKPSNVMVTPDGRAMLLDFGLARPENAPRLTRTGSKLGSLDYMAPEQARGDVAAIGPRTDVYALGVTLYELLTCARPFAAKSEPQVTAKILEGRALPPRARNPAVSWEAETVCLTAMELDPERRYDGAEAFARDLDSVLQRRPIEARRVSKLLRLRRFVERRPGEAAAALLAAVLVVGAPLGYAWMKGRAVVLLQEKQARAERNFQKALDAVDTMLTRVGDETLRYVPEMDEVRRGLLEDALGFYRGFVDDASGDASIRGEAARIRLRVGEVRTQLGDLDAAEQTTRQAIDELEALVTEDPRDAASRRALGEAYEQLATLFADLGRAADAADAVRTGIARIEAAPDDPSPADLASLSALHHALGLYTEEDPDVDSGGFATALALAERLLASDPSSLLYRAMVATSASMLGTQFARVGRIEEALAHERRAIRMLDALAAEDPGDRRHARTCAGTLYNLSSLVIEKDPAEAERLCERALAVWAEEARRHPSALRFVLELCKARDRLSRLAHGDGRVDEAAERTRGTIELLREFVARHPRMVEARFQLGITLNSSSVQLRTSGRAADGLRDADEGVSVIDALLDELGPDADFLHHLGGLHHNAACCLLELGDVPAAVARFAPAIDASARATELEPGHARARVYLRNHHWMLAETCLTANRAAAVVAAAERLPQIFPDGPAEWRRAAAFVARAAWLVEGDEALEYDRRALELLHAAIDRGYADLEDLACEVFARVRELQEFEALLQRVTTP